MNGRKYRVTLSDEDRCRLQELLAGGIASSRQLTRARILLKADEDVPMGIISDVKQELKKANARRIVFAANWKKL